MPESISTPQLELALELRVNIGPTLEIGAGFPASDARSRLQEEPLADRRSPAGYCPEEADWQIVERDGLTFVDAQYVIETEDGVCIEVRNRGVRYAPEGVLARIGAGEPVPSTQYYFRTTPRFYPPHGKYDWLKRSVFIADAERYRDLVIVKVWRVV